MGIITRTSSEESMDNIQGKYLKQSQGLGGIVQWLEPKQGGGSEFNPQYSQKREIKIDRMGALYK
jgi:hypothetical protein